MISPMKIVTLLAATMLAVLPSATATCNVQELAVYTGRYDTWNATNNEIYTVRSPSATQPISNQDSPRTDVCIANCQPNVVLLAVMETIANTFYVAINGRYLLNNYSWSIPQTTSLPRTRFTTWETTPANTLLINLQTPKARGSSDTFFTGQYLYRTPYFSTYQPIYEIEFPYWQCPTRTVGNTWTPTTNYVQVANDIPLNGWGCGGYEQGALQVRRLCSPNIRGDPQFSGLRGQDYQVHGIDGAIYNLITAPALSVTSRFVWLDGPRDCPIMPSTGQKSVACWAHKGSYLDNLAIINNAGAKILIQSGPASSGLASVEVDGQSVKMGASIEFGKGGESLHYNSTHEVTVVAGVFTMVIENSDGFVNLRSIGVKGEDWVQLKNDDTHGLLGQTWRKSTSKKVIEGRVDDYLVASGELFGSDFMYNRYQGAHA